MYTKMSLFIASVLVVTLTLAARAETDSPGDPNLKLWYTHEARTWMPEALPIGNGYMGAMLYGGVHSERVQFNEGTLWAGGKFQNFGEVVATFRQTCLPGKGEIVQNYRRELDLNRSIHTVSYDYKGVHFLREAFASYPARAVVLRWTADKPGGFSADFAMNDAHDWKPQARGNCIATTGICAGPPNFKMNYESQLRVINQGGTLQSQADGTIRVENADSVVVLLGAGTDFLQDSTKNFRGGLPHDALTARLDAAAKRGWDDLLVEHEKDYGQLFNRLAISLGAKPSSLPTDQRLDVYAGDNPDLGLEELLFQYGRYLLISASRKGGTPANLQGQWSNTNSPPWNGDYHCDVNFEMNYWPAGPANLNECFEPVASFLNSLRPVLTEATQKNYKTTAPGWAVQGCLGLEGYGTWSYIPGSSAWIMQNMYDHYRFTGDKDYLRNQAYPPMKDVCEFWLNRLKTLPDGTLVGPNGYSPEHSPNPPGPNKQDGVSFEQEVIWELFTNTIEAS